MNRTAFAKSICVALLVVGALTTRAPADAPQKLNVLFIAVDDLPMPKGLDGTSFKPLVEDPKREWKQAAFSLWPKKIPDQGSGFGRAIRTDRYRLVEWTVPGQDFAEYELYDHQTDPQENISLAKRPEYKALVEQLAKQLHAGPQAALPASK